MTELESYYACRSSCLQIECSNPCSDELSTAVGCIPSAIAPDCLTCIDSAIKDTIAESGSDCNPLTQGICSAISGGCECGDCSIELDGYYDCVFEADLQQVCPEGLACDPKPCMGLLGQPAFISPLCWLTFLAELILSFFGLK